MEIYHIISRIGCPYSMNAVNFIKTSGKKYIIYNIKNSEKEKNIIKEKLKNIIGNHNTFPIVL